MSNPIQIVVKNDDARDHMVVTSLIGIFFVIGMLGGFVIGFYNGKYMAQKESIDNKRVVTNSISYWDPWQRMNE